MLRAALAGPDRPVVSTGAGSAPRPDAPRNSVGTLALKNGAVTAAKLRRGAVTSAAVRDRSLLAIDFGEGQLPAGPAGPAGPQGPPGVSGLVRVSATSAVDSSSPKTVTVACPAGKTALGGGASLLGAGGGSPPSNVALQRSELTADGAGWTAVGAEVQPTPTTWSVTVTAVCAFVG